ncbi:MAG: hypothetical protein ACREJ5_14565 [Geminicoccaceae bacterium]
MESLPLLNAIALLAVGGVVGCALSGLMRISGRQRRARDEIARDISEIDGFKRAFDRVTEADRAEEIPIS